MEGPNYMGNPSNLKETHLIEHSCIRLQGNTHLPYREDRRTAEETRVDDIWARDYDIIEHGLGNSMLRVQVEKHDW